MSPRVVDLDPLAGLDEPTDQELDAIEAEQEQERDIAAELDQLDAELATLTRRPARQLAARRRRALRVWSHITGVPPSAWVRRW